MCRIFAVRSTEPWAVAPAFQSLLKLSVVHKDGWGVVVFDDPSPCHHRDVCAAHASESFHALTKNLRSKSLVAHIREASVGPAHADNTHPFSNAGWVFCHNGTVRGFEENRQLLDDRIDPKWRAEIRGETDSERCFYYFLTLLDGRRDLDSVCAALSRTVREVAALYPGNAEKPTALNLFVTDGTITAVTRYRKGLYTVARAGISMIASEPIVEGEPWQEVPDEHVFTVDAALHAALRPLT